MIFLAAFPLPLRVDGDAVVAPVHSAQIQPEVEGVVSRVYVREGEHVARDQVIADLADWEARAALAQAQAKYQTALLQMNRSLAANDGSEAGVQRIQADFWKSEVARDQELLDKTRLRSPIDGLVATPHVENMVGRRLQYGDTFAEVVDTSRAVVDVAVDDTDSGLLRAGIARLRQAQQFSDPNFSRRRDRGQPQGNLAGRFASIFRAGRDCRIPTEPFAPAWKDEERCAWDGIRPAMSCFASRFCGFIHEPGRGLECLRTECSIENAKWMHRNLLCLRFCWVRLCCRAGLLQKSTEVAAAPSSPPPASTPPPAPAASASAKATRLHGFRSADCGAPA